MIAEAMKQRALAEFDELVARGERRIRAELSERGWSKAKIATVIERNRPNIEAQRATIGSMVTVALLRAGVPLTGASLNGGKLERS